MSATLPLALPLPWSLVQSQLKPSCGGARVYFQRHCNVHVTSLKTYTVWLLSRNINAIHKSIALWTSAELSQFSLFTKIQNVLSHQTYVWYWVLAHGGNTSTAPLFSWRGNTYMTSAECLDFGRPLPSPPSHTEINWFCSFCLLFGDPLPHPVRIVWPPSQIRILFHVSSKEVELISIHTWCSANFMGSRQSMNFQWGVILSYP